MKTEYLRNPVKIKITSSFLKGERIFKLTQLDYCKQQIEIVNQDGEVISEFPLIWNGLTFDESKERIYSYAHAIRADVEVL